jgi:hypothetical protein
MAAATSLALAMTGCVGLTAHLLYFWKGQTASAAFQGLEGKRVAVVCVCESSAYGAAETPNMLARQVEAILAPKVKDIRLVGQDQIEDWIDRNNWDEIDYREIGRGVKADMVLAIDIDSLRLHDGQTLYRGQANVKTTVYDMSAQGKAVFKTGPRPFVFPAHTAVPVADTNENQFRQLFVRELARHVARYFHEYELKEDFGNDTVLMGQ